jgi:hypothetical protein
MLLTLFFLGTPLVLQNQNTGRKNTGRIQEIYNKNNNITALAMKQHGQWPFHCVELPVLKKILCMRTNFWANELKKFPLGQTALPGRQTGHARDVPFLLVDVQSRFHTGRWMISGNDG